MTEQTSRLSIVVDTTNALQRLAQFRQSLRQTSDSSNLAGRGLQNLSAQTTQLNGRFVDANGRLREANGRFASIAQNAMSASRGVNGLVNPLSRINGLLSRTQAIISGGMFGLFALSVAKTADTMQDLNSQIMLVTKNEQEQLVVKERLHQMANKNLTDLKSTIGLYTNSARALGNMGKSQEEVLKFTNAVSLAMGVGGKSATEQASALLQLGQAMQSGVLQGDEFRSLTENAPIMLDLIAEKLGKTRGQVRKMAGEGKITAEVIYDSLSGATDKLQAMFDKMPVTMSQAFGVVKNNYNVFVDNFINKTTGLSGAVAKGLIGISNHFETIAKVAIAGTGLALVGLASKVTLTTTAFTALKTVMMTHPVLAVATAVLGVSSAFFGLNDVLDTTALVFGELFGLVKTGLGGLADLAWAVGFNITHAFSDSNDKTSQSFFGFFDNTGKGFLGFLHGVTRIVATMSATFAGFLTWVGNGFWQALRGVANAFIWLKNKADSVVQSMVNSVMNGIDKLIDKVNELIGGANSMLAKTPLEIQIKPISKTSYRYQATPTETFDLTGKTLSEHIAPWVANANGGVDTMFASLYSEQAKRNQQAQADLAKSTDANTKAVSDNTKDKKGNKKGDKKEKYSYTAKEIEALKRVQGLIYGSDLKKYAEQKGVPVHMLAGLMMQESRGMQYAKSPTGALGYFQTTKAYRQDMDMSREDSFDLIKSGTKAIDYLAQSYKEFGDWNSAIRSYNAGRGGTRQFNKTGKVSNNEARNKEVREYVPKINKWSAWYNNGNGGLGKDQDIAEQGKDFLENQQKLLEQKQKILDDFAKKFQSPIQKIIQEKQTALSELEKVLSKDDALYQQYKSQIDKASEFEIYNYSKSVKDEIDNVNDYRISEEQKITQKFADMRAEFELNPKFSFWGDENKAKYKEAIDDAEQHSLDQYRLTLAEKMAGLNDFHKTEIQKINEKYDLEAQKIRLNGESEELQDLQLVDNEGKRKKEIADKQKSARENYDAFNAEINGTKEQYDLAKQFDNRLEIIKEALNAQIIVLDEFNNKKLKLEQDYNIASQRLQLSQYANIADNITNIGKMMLGENSRTYKALFAMNQSFVIAQAGINMYKAISDAWATGATLPQKIAGAMTASSELVKIISAVQSVKMQGFKTGGYTGNVGTSQVAGVVHGQEYVLNAQATKRLGVDNLNRLNRGDTIGTGQVINVNVTVNSDGTSSVDSQVQIGKHMGEAIKIAVQQELRRERMQGGVLYGR